MKFSSEAAVGMDEVSLLSFTIRDTLFVEDGKPVYSGTVVLRVPNGSRESVELAVREVLESFAPAGSP